MSPLFVIDIRDEYKHIPVFHHLNNFIHYLMKGAKLKQYNQIRFNFSNKKEYMKLFQIMAGFRNCTIVVDEADAIFSDRQFLPPLTDVFLGSRNNGVTLLFIGKRPFLIPIMIRSQADRYTVFRIEEENDIRYLNRRVRQDMPKDPFKLDKGEAIIFESGEKPRIEKFPMFIPQSSIQMATITQ